MNDSVELEYQGIINYAIMALIQLDADVNAPVEMKVEEGTYKQDYSEFMELNIKQGGIRVARVITVVTIVSKDSFLKQLG